MRDNKGRFIKGSSPPILTSEGRKRISEANKGKKRSEEFKRNLSIARKGVLKKDKHWMWHGGRYVTGGGYIFIHSPNHPYKTNGYYVLEHRLVMEKKIGRYLLSKEMVHHINHNPSDNRIENLMLLSPAQHNTIHFKGRKRNGIRGKFLR